jgi:hypothetical protein
MYHLRIREKSGKIVKIQRNFRCLSSGLSRFSEESQDRVIQFLEKYESVTKDDSIIDIGSGNGLMLIELLSVGYKNLTGKYIFFNSSCLLLF